MVKCEDWRIFRGQFNLVHILCMYAMGLSGVREEGSKRAQLMGHRETRKEREKEGKEREHEEGGEGNFPPSIIK